MNVGAVNWFSVPVGCPRPKNNESITTRHIEGWLSREGSKESIFKKLSNGTYLSGVSAAIGFISGAIGLKKENSLLTWGGMLLAGIGAGAIAVNELFSSLHKWIMLNPVKIEKDEIVHAAAEYERAELVEINGSQDTNLFGCYFRAEKDTGKTILYLHGRANHTVDCLETCNEMRKHSGANVLVADYRGYGASEGKASQDALIRDARRMYNHLIEQGKKAEDIVICGHSLGGAVAIQLVKELQDEGIAVPKLVLQSTFKTPEDVAHDYTGKYVPKWIVERLVDGDRLKSIETIKEISKNIPIHIFHGKDDNVILFDQAEALHEACGNNATLTLIDGCDHGNVEKFIGTNTGLREAITPN